MPSLIKKRNVTKPKKEQPVRVKQPLIDNEFPIHIWDILLTDRSSKHNIIWATELYAANGVGFGENDEITYKKLFDGKKSMILKPRVDKSKEEQEKRIKDKAEVFTPAWVCNEMINNLDQVWFNHKSPFNNPHGQTWTPTTKPIKFPEDKTWQDYVKLTYLEITCGEAPFLVSRYDSVSGEHLALPARIGILDRKLRVVSENAKTVADWWTWVQIAYQATYAYEWQGDNLIIARKNLLLTFVDYYQAKFNKQPEDKKVEAIANIISWNVWQMDGRKCVVPNTCKPVRQKVFSLFGEEETLVPCVGCKNQENNKEDNKQHTGVLCQIMNWEDGKAFAFNSIK